MTYTLKPHQKEAIAKALPLPLFFNFDDMGLGKTLVSLEIIKQSRYKKVLVICPAFLKSNWEMEIARFTPELQEKIEIISYSSLNKLEGQGFDCVVLDESHYIKNINAKRTVATLALIKSTVKKVIFMTGTPLTVSANDVYPYYLIKIQLLGGHYYDFWQWQSTTCNKIPCNFSPSGYKYEGISERGKDLIRKHISPYSVRRKTQEVIDLPHKHFHKYHSPAKKSYRQFLQENYQEILSYSQASEEWKPNFLKAKRVNAEKNAKVTKNIIDNLLSTNSHIVVFSDHRKSAEILAEAYKTTAIMGGVKQDTRTDTIEKWKKSGGVLVGTYKAMGTGLNLTEASHCIFNDSVYEQHIFDQSLKRIHRMGQVNDCHYHFIYNCDIDLQILDRMMEKAKILNF